MAFNVSPKRIYACLIVFGFVALVIVGRLFFLQVIDAEAKTKEAIQSRTIRYETMPKRGTIYDRNGNVLAYSTEAKTVYANPSEIENNEEVASKLAKHLGGGASDYIDKISNKELKFSYIKRRIDVDVAQAIKDEDIYGIYFQDDQKRIYPYGQVAGQIIGSINIDGDGLCGIELYYDDLLRGSTGRTIRQQGNQGMPIPGGVLQEVSVVDGQDIMLTIDIELQKKAEETLIAWNKKFGTSSMNTILMDPTNGEIYAAASLPLLNPADLSTAEEGATDLKCISTNFEPGSTFKTFAAMSMLEDNALTPDTQIYCPNTLEADEYVIKDAHDRESQTFTLREILARSSNIGISLATEKYGWDRYHDKFSKYRILEKTDIDYPGDGEGYVLDFDKWSKIHAYNISFGQGVSVTPIQIAKFYSAIANDGVENTPHFLMRYLQSEIDEEYDQHEIIDNKNSIPTMLSMLRSVVTDGTGTLAEIPGYGVCGKTGTAETADDKGEYLKDCYFSSFCGFLAGSNVPMLCFVGAERAPYDIAVTPVWKEIMTTTIERLKLAAKG